MHVWHLLTSGRGWSGEEYHDWIGSAMCNAALTATHATAAC